MSAPARRALAPLRRRLLSVTANERLGAYRVLKVSDPDGPTPDPGQFAMLATGCGWGGGEDERPYLPRAFSFARVQDGEAHYLLEDVGPGTRRLGELRVGEQVWTLGPLGRGFSPPPQHRRALLVGGGAGIAPLAILQDALEGRYAASSPAGGDGRAWRGPVAALLGFRDEAHAAGAGLLRGAQLASDDGSVGHAGLVTDLLEQKLAEDPEAVVYACGPGSMLETVRALCTGRGVPAQLALEAGMACGFGACYGCVVPRSGGGYLRVCVDGPVLDAGELDHIDEHAGAPHER
jgi:dihydroorotate dehydrogenase electron transfer subunit